MALATRTIDGNNSGSFSRKPKIVVMHATRSGIASKTDAQELSSTLNWFVNPDGASSHWVLSKLERVRVVADTLLAWHSSYLNGKAWGMEFTQPTIDRTFGKGHYDNAALIGRHYVKLGVKPVWLDYWDGNLTQSGFVDHEDTVQGSALGKSDMGYRFDRPRFISSLEEDMPLNATDKTWLRSMTAQESKKAIVAALAVTAKDVKALRASVRGGELDGNWWKVKGKATIWFVQLVSTPEGFVLVRHSARNPASYHALGGGGVITVTQAQLGTTIKGPPLPDLKV